MDCKKINVANAIKVYLPSENQVYKYKMYYVISQNVFVCFVLSLAAVNKWLGDWYNTDICFLLLFVFFVFSFVRYKYFFAKKDIYTVYLFRQRVLFEYHRECLFFTLRKIKVIEFNDLKTVRFGIYPVVAGMYSYNSYEIYFKMKKAEDFSFKTRGDKQTEKIAEDINKELEQYRLENSEIAKKLFEI